jgi:hypothetical protein
MASVAHRRWVIAIGALAAAGSAPAFATTGTVEPQQIAEATARILGEVADLRMRFVQEDGPESGHVRVELTPETRALTRFEARSVAERAFLETLGEPGLGDNLTRITVIVRLMPASYAGAEEHVQTIVYQHKSGRDWAVLPVD